MLDETQVRLEKLEKLRRTGRDPYAKVTNRNATVGEVLQSFDAWSASGKALTLAGRLMTTRVHGGMLFADLEDGSGRMQVALKEDEIGEKPYGEFRDLLDPGDIVEVSGTLFTTRRGEKSIKVNAWNILAKALRPLPEKWHGLQDVEKRYRHRELDLLSNPEAKQRFLVRSKLISSLRRFMETQGFIEMETPVLQPIPGGANARPFVTHHHTLDIDLYLRIAPELYLKRLLVAGFEKIYEIARCFRNEGIDHAHNPEFTQIEAYWAYADKEAFFGMLEQMLVEIVRDSVGAKFEAPFERLTFREAILNETGIDIDKVTDEAALKKAVKSKKISVDFGRCVGYGEHVDELYKKTARPKLTGPVWILDYPVEMKPLANRTSEDPTKSATAQLIIGGAEIVNAYYHELHDPIDQRARFEEQQALAEQGSEEAQRMDSEFLGALEQGMPPAAGFGMGIDRLVAVITGASTLKEVILFPTLRPVDESHD